MGTKTGLVCMILALSSCGPSHTQAEPWEVEQGEDADMCTATAPGGGDILYGVSAVGPDFVFKMEAPDFPKANRAYRATFTLKGNGSGPVGAQGSDGMIAVSLGRGELAQALVKAKEATLEVEGHSHSVSLEGAADALDRVARCAKQRTLAEAPEKPPLPIPNAGDWTLYETTPYGPDKACMAHLDDPEVDTMLQYDEKGVLELIGGNPIWTFPHRVAPMRISIDGGPDLALSHSAEFDGHVFTLKIDDPKMIAQLRHARVIDWVLPKGSLRSHATGLGTALDAVQQCRAKASA